MDHYKLVEPKAKKIWEKQNYQKLDNYYLKYQKKKESPLSVYKGSTPNPSKETQVFRSSSPSYNKAVAFAWIQPSIVS